MIFLYYHCNDLILVLFWTKKNKKYLMGIFFCFMSEELIGLHWPGKKKKSKRKAAFFWVKIDFSNSSFFFCFLLCCNQVVVQFVAVVTFVCQESKSGELHPNAWHFVEQLSVMDLLFMGVIKHSIFKFQMVMFILVSLVWWVPIVVASDVVDCCLAFTSTTQQFVLLVMLSRSQWMLAINV